ncbi:KAP family P-loop NTPase fold protein [Paractinoplanes deccanensis]|nr:P-loop NTPase fold protein [Actinoplanes deccanensis]
MVQWMSISTGFEPDMPIARDFWTADDALGYAPYADAIAAFVRHRGTRPPLTIGVTAPWGAGKTSLMRMVQERLDPRADRDRWTATPLRLSDDARRSLRPKRGAADEPVTNRELLARTTEPVPDTDDLDVQPPHSRRIPDDEWRPTVWFNPWMYQSGEQIWAGLAYEIITQVTGRLKPADRERFWLALNLRRVDRQALRRRIYQQLAERFLPWLLWLGLAVAIALIGVLVAIVVPPAADALRAVSAGLASVGGATFVAGSVVAALRFLRSRAAVPFGPLLQVPNPVQAAAGQAGAGMKGAYPDLVPDPRYESRLGFLHLVQTDMRRVLDLVATERRPLVVFVDDLDRCSPGTVVQVIEAINLFLAGEFPHCVFVVAMEPAVVAAHVEAVYKDLASQPAAPTLGWRFLEKIVQLPLSLPPPDPDRQRSRYMTALLDQPRGSVPPATAEPAASPPVTPPLDSAEEPSASPSSPPAEAPGAGAADDAGRAARVRLLEIAIRRRSPVTDTLAAAALQAQKEVLPEAGDNLLPETSEAANRVLVGLYSDDEARTAIVAGVPGLDSDNPREIKRFVNLFRFYRFVVQQQQLQGLPPVSGAEIAKLAAFAIRWPHLLAEAARGNLGRWEQGDVAGAPILPTPLLNFLRTEPRIGAAGERLL